jgi:hypothetical protein
MTGPQQPYPYQGYPPKRPRSGLPVWAVLLIALGALFAGSVMFVGCVALVASSDVDPDPTRPPVVATPTGTGEAPPPPAETPVPAPTGLFQHPEDVTLESCGPGSLGWGDAGVRVTNNSSEASTYSIQVAFESPDRATLYATGYAFVSRLEPGQTTVSDASTATEVPADVVCRVTQASRYRD